MRYTDIDIEKVRQQGLTAYHAGQELDACEYRPENRYLKRDAPRNEPFDYVDKVLKSRTTGV
jgi:hypothetical protein